MIDFTLDVQMQSGSLIDTLERRRAKAEGKAVIDFAFHSVINNGSAPTLKENQDASTGSFRSRVGRDAVSALSLT